MKKCLKSTLSILLVAVLLLTVVPFGVLAAEDEGLSFTVSSKNAVPGETVDVNIAMTNNPGIASIGLNVGYDSDILTIENITFNSAMGGTTQTSQLTKNPVKLIWISSTNNYNDDANVATITFKVNGNVTDNATTNIELTYDPDILLHLTQTVKLLIWRVYQQQVVQILWSIPQTAEPISNGTFRNAMVDIISCLSALLSE